MFNMESVTVLATTLEEEFKNEIGAYDLDKSLDALHQSIATTLSNCGMQGVDIMHRYRWLLQKEQDMYDPYSAYMAGQSASPNNQWQAFTQYLHNLMLDSENQHTLRERGRLYFHICDALRENECYILLDDYNEAFKQYHGIVGRNIDFFFNLGYYAATQR